MIEKVSPTRPWPGRTDSLCPECGAPDYEPWDMEYFGAKIEHYGSIPVVIPVDEKLISLTCPACKTRFTVP